jgi:phosphohistidine phosphatase
MKRRSMKKLIFIRHAKAEDYGPELPDFERSLVLSGKKSSRLMASILKSKEKDPGLVLSSHAFRALETALIFCREYDISIDKIRLFPGLYTGMDTQDIASVLKAQSDDIRTITLFGHNPLITGLATFFAVREPEDIPKTGILCLSFDKENWADIGPGSGKTIYFLKPKSLL